jgi:hypothetical protein
MVERVLEGKGGGYRGGAGHNPCSAVALLRNSTALQLISLAVC